MKSKWRASAVLEILVDQLLIAAGYAISLWLKFGTTVPEHNIAALRDTLPLAAVFGFFLLAVYGAYADKYRPLRETLVNLAAAIALLAVGVSALAFFLRGFAFPRSVLVMAPAVQMALLSAWHGVNHLRRRRRRGVFKLLAVGGPSVSPELLAKMERSLLGNRLIALEKCVEASVLEAHLSRGESLQENVFAGMDGLLLLQGTSDVLRREMARYCAKTGMTLLCMPNPEDVLLSGAGLHQFGDVPVLAMEPSGGREDLQWLKRLFDMVFSLATLILSLPFSLLTVLLVHLSGPGPVFFVQERVTKDGQVFWLIKFRTMVQNAEGKTGPVLSVRNDPRITPIGRFLRKSRLDELPQLWNILKGDMSLVGPRPERPVFVERFEREMPGYRLRHGVRAGLTGMAQVYGNYATSAADKLVFDLLYIRDWSLLLDMQIVLRTATAVFRREASEGITETKEEAES